jgi:mannose-6-phosphate isomerase-like protein (cupin superfamily)
MRKVLLGVVVLIVAGNFVLQAQQKPRGVRTATLAISVTDPGGQPVRSVAVTLEGPASRTTRTEGGRIALEGLPPGRYTIRFEREGFVTLERELTATAGKPMEVQVTLKPLPQPAPAPAHEPAEEPVEEPVEGPAPKATGSTRAKPAVFDVPGVIEKEWIGRAAGKTTPLACGQGGTATLIQLNQPLTDHAHADADEFVYVVAGEGAVRMAGSQQKVSAGVLVFVPRGIAHTLTPSGRNPLIVLATRAGAGC